MAKLAHGAETPTAGRAVDEERLRRDRVLFQRFVDERDPVDREILIERFLPLARSLAARYRHPDEPFDDVFQVACMGLVHAIDRYDLSRGRAFSSFAVPTIVGEIKRHYRDKTWTVRVPRDLQDLAIAVDRVARELETQLGRQPTVSDLADALALTDEVVLEALQARQGRRVGSLDVPYGDGDPTTLGETIAAHDDGFDRAEQRAVLARLTAILTPRERLIVELRFTHDLTQAEIGDQVGLSQMQISRILRQALIKVRNYAAPEDHGDIAA
jgi:RNA polymerase sigma-B factor